MPGQYVPTGHEKQVELPVALVNQPAMQVVQEDDPDAAENLPAAHATQVVEDAEYDPAVHAMHEVAPGDIA